MGSDAKARTGALGRIDLLTFNPDDLTIVQETPDHPLYDPRADMALSEATIETMVKYGVLLPISVRENGVKRGGRPNIEVIFGRQRVRHLREANKRRVKLGMDPLPITAQLRRCTDDELRDMIIIENAHRTDDAPSQRAERVRYCSETRKMANQEIAMLFNVDVQTIKSDLILVDLNPKIVKRVDAGDLSVTTATRLKDFPREEQVAELAKLEQAGILKGAAGRKAIEAAAKNRKAGKTEESEEDTVILPTKRQIRRLLESIESTEHGGRNGEIKAALCQAFHLVLDGKRPRGGDVLSPAWTAILKEDRDKAKARAERAEEAEAAE